MGNFSPDMMVFGAGGWRPGGARRAAPVTSFHPPPKFCRAAGGGTSSRKLNHPLRTGITVVDFNRDWKLEEPLSGSSLEVFINEGPR